MAEQTSLRRCTTKPRVFVVTDISNEPDDAESMVRYLLYNNEFDTKGLVACTSTWMRDKVHPEDIETIVKAYGQVVDNLNAHVHPENRYPSADSLLKLIKTGPEMYGKKALEPDVPLSDGAAALVEELRDESDERPLWVPCWGGTNVLAQALQHIQQNYDPAEAAALRQKLRVYTISDQDDTGYWIRLTFPDVFYICSVHGWNQYSEATWTGISGDLRGGLDEGGPDTSIISKEWLRSNIQIGPLGSVYPDYKFIVEGDTPTFLYLVQNGLGSPEHPDWGSWGGRYGLIDAGGAARHYADMADTVTGANGKRYVTSKGTIWRWRDAYQHDFAARMQWTLTDDRSKVNHAPVVVVNGSSGAEPLVLDVEAAEEIELDASATYDPDGDELTFRWFQYREPSISADLVDPMIPDIAIQSIGEAQSGRRVKLQLPPAEECAIDMRKGTPLAKGVQLHFVLEVKDNGSPSLVSYKRVVIQVTNRDLKGGRSTQFETVEDWLDSR